MSLTAAIACVLISASLIQGSPNPFPDGVSSEKHLHLGKTAHPSGLDKCKGAVEYNMKCLPFQSDESEPRCEVTPRCTSESVQVHPADGHDRIQPLSRRRPSHQNTLPTIDPPPRNSGSNPSVFNEWQSVTKPFERTENVAASPQPRPAVARGPSHTRPSGGFVNRHETNMNEGRGSNSSPSPPRHQQHQQSSNTGTSPRRGSNQVFKTVNLRVDRLLSRPKSDEKFFEINVL